MKMYTALSLSLLVSLSAACSEQFPKEVPQPKAVTPTPTTNIQVVRKVEVRSPFGKNDVEQNLLADGDFEFTGRSQQMPWISFGQNGQNTLSYETGGKCVSGIRCASLAKGNQLIGWVSSPRTGKVAVSLYVHPSTGVCADTDVFFIDVDDQSRAATIKPPAAPDAAGWCKFEATTGVFPDGQPAIYVEPKADETWLDAGSVTVVAPAGGTPSPGAPVPGDVARFETTSAPLAAKIGFIGAWVKAHRMYGLQKERPLDNPPVDPKRAR
jgi:hypothetical protein